MWVLGRVLLDVHFLNGCNIYIYTNEYPSVSQWIITNLDVPTPGERKKTCFFFPALLSPWFFPPGPGGCSAWNLGGMGRNSINLIAQQKSLAKIRETTIPKSSNIHHSVPAPSKKWCLNPKGLPHSTPYHPLGTPWRVQVHRFWSRAVVIRTLLLWPRT